MWTSNIAHALYTFFYKVLVIFLPLAPLSITQLRITSSRTLTSSNRTVQLNITWVPPSARNGSYSSVFILFGDQIPFYPPERRRSTPVLNMTLNESTNSFFEPSALPYAEYRVTVQPFNIKTGNKATAVNGTHQSIAIGKC